LYYRIQWYLVVVVMIELEVAWLILVLEHAVIVVVVGKVEAERKKRIGESRLGVLMMKTLVVVY